MNEERVRGNLPESGALPTRHCQFAPGKHPDTYLRKGN